jgi:hydrogenase maturation protein HypF
VAAVASDLDAGAAPADVSARFHATVAAFTHEALRHLRTRTGVATVALTGGVFQNAVLLEDLAARLRSDGFDVLVHRRVPTNDGGISLGQAIVASQQQHTREAAVVDGWR